MSVNENELSSAERLEWLRSRGIVVETPEERRAKAIANIMKEQDDDENDDGDGSNDIADLYNSSCRRDDTSTKTRREVDGSNGRVKQEKGFSWTQTKDELEVVVVLPNTAISSSTAVTSKDVQVTFRARSLFISYQNQTLGDLQLFEEIDIETSTWTLDKSSNDGTKLMVTMEKVEQALWTRIQD